MQWTQLLLGGFCSRLEPGQVGLSSVGAGLWVLSDRR